MILEKEVADQAACKGNTSLFYVDSGPISNKSIRAAIGRAKALCNSCSIQVECLVNSVNNKEEFGIWGGLTSKERTKIFEEDSQIDYDQAFEVVKWLRSI